MSIAFRCPQCGKSFSVGDEFAGKKARCKQCGATMSIPTPAPAASKAAPPPVDLYDLDEPAPVLRRVPTPEPAAGPSAKAKASGSGFSGSKAKNKGGESGDGLKKGLFGGGIGGFFLVFFLVRIAFRVAGGGGGGGKVPPAPAAPPAFVASPAALPKFPDRGEGNEVEPGVMFQAVRMGPRRPGPGVPPAHGMTMWLYLPAGRHEPGSLPCVMIAPAGSILITGNELSPTGGDHPEHLPYVRAGFAVLAYGLDGELTNQEDTKQLKQAAETFLAARAGLTNAQTALAWLRARVPEVDPDRVYAAGHSSAGTMALLFAENEPKVKACAAFAPRADVETNFSFAHKLILRGLVPRLNEFFTTYNPVKHAASLNVPVFLFHARDDSVVPVADTEAFASTLRGMGKNVTLEVVPTGDHHQSMIRQGVPKAIEWLKGVDGRVVAPAPPAARVEPSGPPPGETPPQDLTPQAPTQGAGAGPGPRPPGVMPPMPRIPRPPMPGVGPGAGPRMPGGRLRRGPGPR